MDQRGPSLLRFIVLGLGFFLIGIGVLLICTAYWYSFAPNGRVDWVFALVLLALLAVGFTMGLSARGSWFAEGAAIFYMLAMGVGLFLVADTYYTGISYPLCLLLTLALSLPVIYLLDGSIAMILYLLGASWWSFTSQDVSGIFGIHCIWILLLLGFPMYWMRLRRHGEQYYTVMWLSWSYVVAVFSASFCSITSFHLAMEVLLISLLSTITFSIGVLSKEKGIWALPFRCIGVLGLFYTVVYGTYIHTWVIEAKMSITVVAGLLAGFGFIVWLYIMWELMRKEAVLEWFIGLTPLVLAFCLWSVHLGMTPLTATVIFNAFVLFIVLLLIMRGTILKRVGYVNGSVLVVIGMVGTRLFDPDFTFLERGISFLLIGIIIVVINGLYMQHKIEKRKRAPKRRLRRKKSITKGTSAEARHGVATDVPKGISTEVPEDVSTEVPEAVATGVPASAVKDKEEETHA